MDSLLFILQIETIQVRSDFILDSIGSIVNESLRVFLYGVPCGVTQVGAEYLDWAEGRTDHSGYPSAPFGTYGELTLQTWKSGHRIYLFFSIGFLEDRESQD